jgi:hypothetical protein
MVKQKQLKLRSKEDDDSSHASMISGATVAPFPLPGGGLSSPKLIKYGKFSTYLKVSMP